MTVATRTGRIVGFIAETPGWINHLYVAPDALGLGIGKALLADAKARSTDLALWCFAENHRARAFYEAAGFVAVETTDGAQNEAKAPDIRYLWRR